MRQNELQHHGVPGMRWGVRRYQNKDGSLTNAGKKRLTKELKKDYKRNYESSRPYKTSETYTKKLRDAVEPIITDEDKQRIRNAKDKWYKEIDKSDKAERELNKLARQYGEKYYDAELKNNPDWYDTPRSREELREFANTVGFDEALESRPDLEKTLHSADVHWKAYQEECRKVSDKILGKYGNTKLHESKYSKLTVRDTVGALVMSIDKKI